MSVPAQSGCLCARAYDLTDSMHERLHLITFDVKKRQLISFGSLQTSQSNSATPAFSSVLRTSNTRSVLTFAHPCSLLPNPPPNLIALTCPSCRTSLASYATIGERFNQVQLGMRITLQFQLNINAECVWVGNFHVAWTVAAPIHSSLKVIPLWTQHVVEYTHHFLNNNATKHGLHALKEEKDAG